MTTVTIVMRVVLVTSVRLVMTHGSLMTNVNCDNRKNVILS